MTTSVPGGQEPLALTDFQVEVAQLFFSLPAASGFLLAGGAALVAQHLTTRPTQDLDFFTHFGGSDVPAARDALIPRGPAIGLITTWAPSAMPSTRSPTATT